MVFDSLQILNARICVEGRSQAIRRAKKPRSHDQKRLRQSLFGFWSFGRYSSAGIKNVHEENKLHHVQRILMGGEKGGLRFHHEIKMEKPT